MFSNADEVLKYIKDEDVKFIDVRFCDLPGVMQHFNVPAQSVGETFFTEGRCSTAPRSAASRPSTSRT